MRVDWLGWRDVLGVFFAEMKFFAGIRKDKTLISKRNQGFAFWEVVPPGIELCDQVSVFL